MGQTRFEKREFYLSKQPYRLLPFRFLKFDDSKRIIVNEVGEYLFLSNEDFNLLVHH
jgi:hypothetical protein